MGLQGERLAGLPEGGKGEGSMTEVKTGQIRPAPDCLKCRHYFITHDPQQPRGCRAYGFKSRELPAQVVLATSGLPCHFFTPRLPPQQ